MKRNKPIETNTGTKIKFKQPKVLDLFRNSARPSTSLHHATDSDTSDEEIGL